MKKFAMVLLCIALVLSCTAIAAFASSYVITVDPAFEGETYNAYKIFDVVYTTPTGAADPVYTYTTSASSEWWSVVTTPAVANTNVSGDPATDDVFSVDGLTFTKTEQLDGNDNPIYLVTLTNGDSLTETAKSTVAKTLADKFYANVSGKTAANASPVTVASGATTASLDVGSDGYYFVTTSLGALCALDTTNTTVTVSDKNTAPTVQKKVDNSGTWADQTSVCIGQPVDFQITVTDGDNTDKAMTLTDTMPVGSTLVFESGKQGNFRMSIVKDEENGGGTQTITFTYASGVYTYDMDNDNTPDVTITPNANGRDFVVTFSAGFMKNAVLSGDQIVILYTGALTENAYISGNTDGENDTEAFNDNYVLMEYSNQTDDDTARLLTYEFDMVKVDDDNNVLTGAEFDLYDAATNGNRINVTLIDTDTTTGMKTYMINPDAATSDPIEAGLVRFVGIGEGTYYLEETQAPENYNALTERAEMQVTANSHVTLTQQNTKWSSGFKVVNHSGSILPSTGGIGTYLFYGIGAILVVGAVVVLVSKKRMHAYSE